jgi:hypothetical protein
VKDEPVVKGLIPRGVHLAFGKGYKIADRQRGLLIFQTDNDVPPVCGEPGKQAVPQRGVPCGLRLAFFPFSGTACHIDRPGHAGQEDTADCVFVKKCHVFSLPYGGGLKQLHKQGIGVYFHIPENYQVLEEILTTKSHRTKGSKSNKFLLSGPFFSSFFDLFDLEVNFSSQHAAFKEILMLKK